MKWRRFADYPVLYVLQPKKDYKRNIKCCFFLNKEGLSLKKFTLFKDAPLFDYFVIRNSLVLI